MTSMERISIAETIKSGRKNTYLPSEKEIVEMAERLKLTVKSEIKKLLLIHSSP